MWLPLIIVIVLLRLRAGLLVEQTLRSPTGTKVPASFMALPPAQKFMVLTVDPDGDLL